MAVLSRHAGSDNFRWQGMCSSEYISRCHRTKRSLSISNWWINRSRRLISRTRSPLPTISITDSANSRASVKNDIEGVLRKIEYWHAQSRGSSSFTATARGLGRGYAGWEDARSNKVAAASVKSLSGMLGPVEITAGEVVAHTGK
jgi:hypothetical protein